MSGYGASVSSEFPDKKHINHKNKRKNNLEPLIKGKERIQETDDQERKNDPKKTPPPFKNNEDYIGDTNETTRDSGDYPSATDGYMRNLGKVHEK